MTPFELMFIGHLIGDLLVQTDYQAENKAKGKFLNHALFNHCLVYTLIFVPIFLATSTSPFWLLLVFSSHMLLDRRWPVIKLFHLVNGRKGDPNSLPGWLLFAKDQVIHLLILAFIVLFSF